VVARGGLDYRLGTVYARRHSRNLPLPRLAAPASFATGRPACRDYPPPWPAPSCRHSCWRSTVSNAKSKASDGASPPGARGLRTGPATSACALNGREQRVDTAVAGVTSADNLVHAGSPASTCAGPNSGPPDSRTIPGYPNGQPGECEFSSGQGDYGLPQFCSA
jgi:hypothetical protein